MLSAIWVAISASLAPWSGSNLEVVHTEEFFVDRPNNLLDFDKTKEEKRLESIRMERDNLTRYDQAYDKGRHTASCFGVLKYPFSIGRNTTNEDGSIPDSNGSIVWQCDSYSAFILRQIENTIIVFFIPIVVPVLIFIFLFMVRWIKAGFRN